VHPESHFSKKPNLSIAKIPHSNGVKTSPINKLLSDEL